MGRMVITGANGFLGSNLVKEFLNNGHEVWVVLRPESKKTNVFPSEMKSYILLDACIWIQKN